MAWSSELPLFGRAFDLMPQINLNFLKTKLKQILN